MGAVKKSFIKMERTYLTLTVISILACAFIVDFHVANGMELKTKRGDVIDTGKLTFKEQQDIKDGCCCTDCLVCCQLFDCCCNLTCVQLGLCCNKKLPFWNVRN